LVGRCSTGKPVFCERMLKVESSLADRAAFHFRDEIEDISSNASRAGRDARRGLTAPGVAREANAETVIAPGRRGRRKWAFSTELVDTDSAKRNVIMGEDGFDRNHPFDAAKVHPFDCHHFLRSIAGAVSNECARKRKDLSYACPRRLID